jgi:hypothetical protein
VADPAGRPLQAVRRIRYDLNHHVWELIETLVPSANSLTYNNAKRTRVTPSPGGDPTGAATRRTPRLLRADPADQRDSNADLPVHRARRGAGGGARPPKTGASRFADA